MIWLQHWLDVICLHFPVPADSLRPLLPSQLELDTYENEAWISLVQFRLKLRPAGLPFVQGFSSLVELNVRTYVRHRGASGIYFLRMFADNSLAICAARWLTPLDYRAGTLGQQCSADSWLGHCESTAEAFRLRFQVRPVAAPKQASSGSLEAWLWERYRLFVGTKSGRLLSAQVEHEAWRIVPLVGEVVCQARLGDDALSSALSRPRLMHYSPGVAARFLPFRAARSSTPDLVASAPQLVRTAAPHAGR